MAEFAELEKSTKYLLIFALLLFLLALIMAGRGLIRPWLGGEEVVSPEAEVALEEDVLASPELADLRHFQHIGYPDKEIGRPDLFSWPELSEEDED